MQINKKKIEINYKIDSLIKFCSNLNNKQQHYENKNFFFEFVNDKITIILWLLKSEKYLSEEYDFLIRLKKHGIIYFSPELYNKKFWST